LVQTFLNDWPTPFFAQGSEIAPSRQPLTAWVKGAIEGALRHTEKGNEGNGKDARKKE
jgi:hypothetical protein